ncbi:MAG: EscJ/YscJ/HrcJ family type secretion inner rane ring protein [Herbaspirillum sp.]|nr:EscJ/YscJ/HrcJ family type secretion inner rane ring protein [Herbaspirillum sp.]
MFNDIEAGESGAAARPVHISALVVHGSHAQPSLLIGEIKRFLKNSFNEVNYDDISVVLSAQQPLQHTPPSLSAEKNDGVNPLLMAGVALLVLLAGAAAAWYVRFGPRSKAAVKAAAQKA